MLIKRASWALHGSLMGITLILALFHPCPMWYWCHCSVNQLMASSFPPILLIVSPQTVLQGGHVPSLVLPLLVSQQPRTRSLPSNPKAPWEDNLNQWYVYAAIYFIFSLCEFTHVHERPPPRWPDRRWLRTEEAGSRRWRPASTSSRTTRTSCRSAKATWSWWRGRRREAGGRARSTAKPAGSPAITSARSNRAVSRAEDDARSTRCQGYACGQSSHLVLEWRWRDSSAHPCCLYAAEKPVSPKGTQLTKNYYSVVSLKKKKKLSVDLTTDSRPEFCWMDSGSEDL